MEEQIETGEKKKSKKGKGALFIPAGLFIGMGIGFLMDKLVPGMYSGLGVGFLAFAISLFLEK